MLAVAIASLWKSAWETGDRQLSASPCISRRTLRAPSGSLQLPFLLRLSLFLLAWRTPEEWCFRVLCNGVMRCVVIRCSALSSHVCPQPPPMWTSKTESTCQAHLHPKEHCLPPPHRDRKKKKTLSHGTEERPVSGRISWKEFASSTPSVIWFTLSCTSAWSETKNAAIRFGVCDVPMVCGHVFPTGLLNSTHSEELSQQVKWIKV